MIGDKKARGRAIALIGNVKTSARKIVGDSISVYRAGFKPICAINLCPPITDYRLLITDY